MASFQQVWLVKGPSIGLMAQCHGLLIYLQGAQSLLMTLGYSCAFAYITCSKCLHPVKNQI